ncbi:hypothetical protein [uncultured Winogradskyella sp.]|uniref:hypothetical protein n=1 Tax=Winogradskyella sp. 4-2091 TaxID=3381659 RepID=UPI002634A304|nr:hypothetical protein [uncultured Winogradskyella sp.]
MKKAKDILIFVFAVVVLSTIGFVFFILNDIQDKYNEEPFVQNSSILQTRYLYSFFNDSIKLRTEYRLSKTIKDSVITYRYTCETDLARSLKIDYNLNSKILSFDIGSKYELNKLKVLFDSEGNSFDSFRMKDPIVDGIEPILFNENYGILAFTGALNPSTFFISKKDDISFVRQIEEIFYY